MREIRDIQLRLEFYQSDSKMSKKLVKVSEILEKDSEDRRKEAYKDMLKVSRATAGYAKSCK